MWSGSLFREIFNKVGLAAIGKIGVKKFSQETLVIKLCAVIHTHVDDFLGAVKPSPEITTLLKCLSKDMQLVQKIGRVYTHLGRTIAVTDTHFKICQAGTATNLREIEIGPGRKKERDSPLRLSEISRYESVIGELLWLSNQTRLEHACAVSKASQC